MSTQATHVIKKSHKPRPEAQFSKLAQHAQAQKSSLFIAKTEVVHTENANDQVSSSTHTHSLFGASGSLSLESFSGSDSLEVPNRSHDMESSSGSHSMAMAQNFQNSLLPHHAEASFSLTDIKRTKQFYTPVILQAIDKINKCPRAKTSPALVEIILNIQKNWRTLRLCDSFIQTHGKGLQNLTLLRFTEAKTCEEFVHALYHLSQHRNPLHKWITHTKKPTNSIKYLLKHIGYVHKKAIGDYVSYSGFVADGKPHGYGKGKLQNGDFYEGLHTKGMAQGRGTGLYADGLRYEGGWLKDEKSGFGIIFYPDGRRLEGDFLEDRAEGFGINIHTDGKTYEGYFHKGKSSGFGIGVFSTGERYEGEFLKGLPNGFGLETTVTQEHSYEGNWLDGKKSGWGIKIWVNGNKYEGNWLKSKAHGAGVLTKADGTVIEGFWENGDFEQAAPVQELMAAQREEHSRLKQKMIAYKQAHRDAQKRHRLQIKQHYTPGILDSTPLPSDVAGLIAGYLEPPYLLQPEPEPDAHLEEQNILAEPQGA